MRSLAALARIERLLGHFDVAHCRLEEAKRAGAAQPASSGSHYQAEVLIECGHLACAEQEWLGLSRNQSRLTNCLPK